MLKYIMLLNTKKLPDNPAELIKIIGSLNESFLELNTSYTEVKEENKNQKIEINLLQERYRLLLQKHFGKKSEKYILPEDVQKQLPLFNEIESALEEVEKEVVTVPEHKRKKGGRKPIPDDLPCTEIIYDIPEEEKICGYGIYKTVVPKSLLGQAVTYTLSNWKQLIRYADSGYVSIDNNGAENALRPFVIGRKNWLFSGSPNGAKASALFYSLIETAKSNDLEPYYYLRYVLEKAMMIKDDSEFKNLLPQNINKEDFFGYIKKSRS